ncbi:MAG TPA: D-alanyl-D-alanine carboxypeptidase, partial [Actinomycetes bacterium]|nr:D-alanyl-D-alanine carboxypeptidase [Actinomycetes bacterium]
VGAAKRGGHTLVVTILDTVEPTDDVAKRLLDWGFDHRDSITPVGQLVAPVGTSHVVRAASSANLAATATVAQAAGLPVGWFAIAVVALLLVATWFVLSRAGRRPRRASLPPV